MTCKKIGDVVILFLKKFIKFLEKYRTKLIESQIKTDTIKHNQNQTVSESQTHTSQIKE